MEAPAVLGLFLFGHAFGAFVSTEFIAGSFIAT